MSSSSFFKSSGTSVTLQNTVDQLVTDAETAKAAAETAATNAASSASLSSTYANNSNTSATNAAASLTSAQSAQSAAETAETNAETAQTAAETAETNAASSASTASTQASNASTSATNAASSASTATTKASEASTSATNAATSETNAATSATNAASSATTASGHASTASTQASNASTSATNAASSASAASTSETNAATSESNASTSATNAATSASTASTQATNASNSATAAATSATNAASSATSAASSASTAQTLSDDFGEKYRIASTAPTTSLDVGDLYFDTTQNELKVYKSSGWAAAGSTVNGTSARFHYDITGTPTSVSGADANGNTLAYDAGYVDVYVNGVRMSDADITITSGNTITFTEALSNGDEVDIVAYGTFVATVLNADNLDSGTVPDARITGAYTGITNLTMSGDLTVDTNTLFVDSANNRVGIGTASSLVRDLNINGTAANSKAFVRFSHDGLASTGLDVGYSSAGYASIYNAENTAMVFSTNASEAMRIDSSGNLLVGKTSADTTAIGIEARSVGLLVATRTSGQPIYANLRGDDGDVIGIAKDDVKIGSIGVISGDNLAIASTSADHAGLMLGGHAIIPMEANAQADGTINFGSASKRFQNLYLSGGVYLGGTGSANYLDDYEEGSFNTALGAVSASTNAGSGNYVKIGTMVFCRGYIAWTGLNTTDQSGFQFNLPFTADESDDNGLDLGVAVQFSINSRTTTGFTGDLANIHGGRIRGSNFILTNSESDFTYSEGVDATGEFHFHISYKTT